MRSAWSKFPYEHVPFIMAEELAKFVVLWLNNFPPSRGVSTTLSPRQIVRGDSLDVTKHCRLEFGVYAHVYVDPLCTNTMEPRTIGCICLGPADNLQGNIKFLNLHTGKITL